jgi:hypothetical protein
MCASPNAIRATSLSESGDLHLDARLSELSLLNDDDVREISYKVHKKMGGPFREDAPADTDFQWPCAFQSGADLVIGAKLADVDLSKTSQVNPM